MYVCERERVNPIKIESRERERRQMTLTKSKEELSAGYIERQREEIKKMRN